MWFDNKEMPREEHGQFMRPPGNYDGALGDVYWNHPEDQQQYYQGPTINGKKPGDLIISGYLTPSSIRLEDKKIVYDDILLGLTDNKNLLAKKIDLIIDSPVLVNGMLKTQYDLAIKQMRDEYRGYHDTLRDRAFQFLVTVNMLFQKGYDMESLTFSVGEYQDIGIEKLLANFRKCCNEYEANSIDSVAWFVDGKVPDGYDMRKVKSPWLFTGMLIRELYAKNPERFDADYENYKITTKMPLDQQLTYEQFLETSYGVILPEKKEVLDKFKEESAEQMCIDQQTRQENVINFDAAMLAEESIAANSNNEQAVSDGKKAI